MPFKKQSVTLETFGESKFKLVDTLVYEGKEQTFTVPAGSVTDFASVPKTITWLIPPYGKYTLAAILHDWLCEQLNKSHYLIEARKHGPTIEIATGTPSNSRDTDGIFRRVMRELEVGFIRRWVMWTGVRWGALFNPARRKDWHKDAAMVLLWSIIAAPVVIPASILVAISLGIDKIVSWAVDGFFK